MDQVLRRIGKLIKKKSKITIRKANATFNNRFDLEASNAKT
jgi:hypothetical protein